MTPPQFVVPVEDLRSGEKERQWALPVAWLSDALSATDARPTAEGSLHLHLGLSGRRVVVRGTARASLEMPCARTLDPVPVEVSADVFLLLSPASVPTVPGQRAGGDRARRRGSKRNQRKTDDDDVLSDEDAAHDTYDGERVVLDDFIREFIQLELPMVPLRSDLRSDTGAGIEAPPAEAGGSVGAPAVDPRLAPLAAIASRLRQTKE